MCALGTVVKNDWRRRALLSVACDTVWRMYSHRPEVAERDLHDQTRYRCIGSHGMQLDSALRGAAALLEEAHKALDEPLMVVSATVEMNHAPNEPLWTVRLIVDEEELERTGLVT